MEEKEEEEKEGISGISGISGRVLDESDSIVYLDVGGVYYSTTLSTLRKDRKSMLAAMFSGVYSCGRKDVNGRFFIDRDGTLFRFILNYLRDGSAELMNDEGDLRQLLREAQYFRIEGLINDVNAKIDQCYREKRSLMEGEYAVVYMGGYGKSAQVYTKDTSGGFSESCATLNKLASTGFKVEGVASGANGNYYALLRSFNDINIKSFTPSHGSHEGR